MRCCWLAITAAFCLAADPPANNSAKKELERLQGEWKVVRAEVGARLLPIKAFQKVTITIKGDEITFRDAETVYDKIRFDPDLHAKPKALELRHTAGLKKGVREQAIYELSADQLKLCIAEPGKKRPGAFVGEENTGQQLFVLKRDKAKR